MPCLLGLLALIAPRLVVFLLWLLTDWFSGVFAMALWPILGFLFLPTTLLWYTAVHYWWAGQWTVWPIVGIVIALMIDMSPARSGRKQS